MRERARQPVGGCCLRDIGSIGSDKPAIHFSVLKEAPVPRSYGSAPESFVSALRSVAILSVALKEVLSQLIDVCTVIFQRTLAL